MSDPRDIDLTSLRHVWDSRREAMRVILRRIDPRGMTRPARDPDESAWLAERGDGGVFLEDPAISEAAHIYYRRRYTR